MLKAKQSLEKHIAKICDRIILDNDKCKKIYNYADKTYKIPKGLVSDLIIKRRGMSEISEFVLFVLLDSICNIEKDNKEINNSNNKKFQNKTPRKSLMIEIEEIVKGVI